MLQEIEQHHTNSLLYNFIKYYWLSSRTLVFIVSRTKTGTISSSLTFFPRRKVSTFSNNNNKEEARTTRAIRISLQRGTVAFFFFFDMYFARVFFTYFNDYHLPRYACIAMKRNRGCFVQCGR